MRLWLQLELSPSSWLRLSLEATVQHFGERIVTVDLEPPSEEDIEQG